MYVCAIHWLEDDDSFKNKPWLRKFMVIMDLHWWMLHVIVTPTRWDGAHALAYEHCTCGNSLFDISPPPEPKPSCSFSFFSNRRGVCRTNRACTSCSVLINFLFLLIFVFCSIYLMIVFSSHFSSRPCSNAEWAAPFPLKSCNKMMQYYTFSGDNQKYLSIKTGL